MGEVPGLHRGSRDKVFAGKGIGLMVLIAVATGMDGSDVLGNDEFLVGRHDKSSDQGSVTGNLHLFLLRMAGAIFLPVKADTETLKSLQRLLP